MSQSKQKRGAELKIGLRVTEYVDEWFRSSLHWSSALIALLALAVACGPGDEPAAETDKSGHDGGGGSRAGGLDTGGDGGSGGEGGSVPVDGGPCGLPYGHARPADIGKTVGAGVVGPEPTITYEGPLTVASPTVIENVVINGCLRIEADDVVLRNVVVKCGGLYPVRASGHERLTIEHSRLECSSHSKLFLIDDHQKVRIANSELTGCEDFFFVNGDVDGLTVSCNVLHSLNLSPESHADGFQIGEAAATTGQIHIRGNYIDPNASGGKTDVVFATKKAATEILVENNFFKIWGLKTLRCGGSSQCAIKHNVYEQAFEQMLQPNKNGKLLFMAATSSGPHSFVCNRLADGHLIMEMQDGVDRVGGATHQIDNCPSF